MIKVNTIFHIVIVIYVMLIDKLSDYRYKRLEKLEEENKLLKSRIEALEKIVKEEK